MGKLVYKQLHYSLESTLVPTPTEYLISLFCLFISVSLLPKRKYLTWPHTIFILFVSIIVKQNNC